jgi:transcriptional regulator with XRE-family HTH domain
LEANILTRDKTIFVEQAFLGTTQRELAERFNITQNRVTQIWREQARKHIDSLELNLMVARKEGNLIGLAIPDAFKEQQDAVIHYLNWCLARLAQRDLKIKVHYRPLPEGQIVFFLEDLTEYGGVQ